MKTNHIIKGFLTLAVLFGITTTARAADTYAIDPVHSNIGFLITHLSVSETQGSFKDYVGSVVLDKENPAASQFEVTIQTKSIDTKNDKRDEHLRSADFFDAEKNPLITFKSTEVKVDGKAYAVTGDLTIKGVTKKATIPFVVAGPVVNPMGGGEVIGVSGQTKINRQDFGVSFNKQMDQGGLMIGDEVQINIHLEAHKK